MNRQKIAAVDIGSSSIRMTIAEIIEGKVRILDELRQPVKLGNDSFNRGKISRTTINDCVMILKNFRKICEEYGVNKIKAVATTAVREAGNSDIFIDNVSSYNNMDVEILSGSRETEYIFKALSMYISKNEKNRKSGNNMIVEIGSGTIEITFFKNDIILFTGSLPAGLMKLKQIFSKYTIRDVSFAEFIISTIDNELRTMKKEFKDLKIDSIYGIGSEVECLLEVLKKGNSSSDRIGAKDIDLLCSKISNYNESEIMSDLNVPYDLTDAFLPAVIIFNGIIKYFKCGNIHIPPVSLRDGMIGELAFRENARKFFSYLEKQVKTGAINIGRSLNFDEDHALKVMEFSLKIFDDTRPIHNLGNMERCYLLAASILHDIGISISSRSHHKHSLYIINSRDFYHFDDNDRNIVANIARYHRRSVPKDTHVEYMRLDSGCRMTVKKLASILRIADSLDNSDLQLVDAIKTRIHEDKLLITAFTSKKLFAEIYSFNIKKDLFEELFGLTAELEIEGGNK